MIDQLAKEMFGPADSAQLREEFPNSPSMWGSAEPAPAGTRPPAPEAPTIPADELAALQRDFPNSWRSMVRGAPADDVAALQRDFPNSWRSMVRGDVPGEPNRTEPDEPKPEPKDDAPAEPPERAALRARAEELGVDPAAIPHLERAQARWKAEVDGWRQQVMADPEIGSSASLTRVRSLVREYGDKDLIAVLDSTGVGNHPSLVRLLSRIARELERSRESW